jgi:hypothetical protein
METLIGQQVAPIPVPHALCRRSHALCIIYMVLAIRGKKESEDGENNDENAGAIRSLLVSAGMQTIPVLKRVSP